MPSVKSTLRLAASCLALAALLSCDSSNNPDTAPSGAADRISGLVTDVVSGMAISGVSVEIQGKSATTGSNGRYSITGLTAGQAALTGKHQGHVNFSQNVTISGPTIADFAMTPSLAANMGGTWRGATPGATNVTMVVAADTIAETIQIALEIRGGKDTFTAPYGGGTDTTINRTSAAFGNISVRVQQGAGLITGSVTNSPDPDIRRIDFSVTGSSAAANVVYTISWSDGTVETEALTLTK
jgi:hypothetical protein